MRKIKYHIKVTEDDIRKGEPIWGTSCPIALACNRVLKKRVSVSPFNVTIYNTKDGEAPQFCNLPDIAHDFIRAFDTGRPVEPFEFDMECR